jgi:hypothetical protein
MTGFEPFSPEYWHEKGVLKALPSQRIRHDAPRRRQRWVAALAISVLALGATANILTIPLPEVGSLRQISLTDTLTSQKASQLEAEVPSGYWKSLDEFLIRAPLLPADKREDPDPFG